MGDEVIVSWPLASGVEDARCVLVFFEIVDAIERRKGFYETKFGLVPRFRAGVHAGKVVVGEMGDFKREIAFLGDTVNTTARVQAATKEHGHDLLVTGAVMERVLASLPAWCSTVPLGDIALRGKDERVSLYGVDRTLDR